MHLSMLVHTTITTMACPYTHVDVCRFPWCIHMRKRVRLRRAMSERGLLKRLLSGLLLLWTHSRRTLLSFSTRQTRASCALAEAEVRPTPSTTAPSTKEQTSAVRVSVRACLQSQWDFIISPLGRVHMEGSSSSSIFSTASTSFFRSASKYTYKNDVTLLHIPAGLTSTHTHTLTHSAIKWPILDMILFDICDVHRSYRGGEKSC